MDHGLHVLGALGAIECFSNLQVADGLDGLQQTEYLVCVLYNGSFRLNPKPPCDLGPEAHQVGYLIVIADSLQRLLHVQRPLAVL